MYIVRIGNNEKELYLAPWAGDLGRTLKRENADEFKTIIAAKKAIEKSKKTHPYRVLSYQIEEK